jgi:hypothetical protein
MFQFIYLGPLTGTAAGLLLICSIINFFMFIFLVLLAASINYLSDLDPEELRDKTFVRKAAGAIAKILPITIKGMHYFKVALFVLILAGYSFNPQPGTDYLQGNSTYNTDIFKCANVTYTEILKDSYKSNIKFITALEGSLIYLIVCILGAIKSMIYEEAFIYQPVSRDSGAAAKCFCHYLGP